MNQMWEILIDITVGEYEHTESIYYFGEGTEAKRYGEAYIQDIWGLGETVWDDGGQCYESLDGERAARLGSILRFKTITAMTIKGTLSYHMEFSL